MESPNSTFKSRYGPDSSKLLLNAILLHLSNIIPSGILVFIHRYLTEDWPIIDHLSRYMSLCSHFGSHGFHCVIGGRYCSQVNSNIIYRVVTPELPDDDYEVASQYDFVRKHTDKSCPLFYCQRRVFYLFPGPKGWYKLSLTMRRPGGDHRYDVSVSLIARGSLMEILQTLSKSLLGEIGFDDNLEMKTDLTRPILKVEEPKDTPLLLA